MSKEKFNKSESGWVKVSKPFMSIRSTYQEGEKSLESRAGARFSRFNGQELLVFL